MENELVFPMYFDIDTQIPGAYFERSETNSLRADAFLPLSDTWVVEIEDVSGVFHPVAPVAPTSHTTSVTSYGRDKAALLSIASAHKSLPGGSEVRSVRIGTPGILSPAQIDTGTLSLNDAEVEPSVMYSGRIAWRMAFPGGESVQVYYSAFITWRDAGGNFISRDEADPTRASANPSWSEGEIRYGAGGVAGVSAMSPAGAAWASVGVRIHSFSTDLLPSWNILVDMATLVIGSRPSVAFFDGETPNNRSFTYYWDGEKDRSSSVRVGEQFVAEVGEIVDPNCPPPPEPPSVPGIQLDCRESIEEWRRVWYIIPTEEVYEWGAVLPIFEISSGADDVDALRISLWENPDDLPPQDFDDTSAAPVGRWNIGYLPANSTMTLDGTTQTVTAQQPGGPSQYAGYLVTGRGNGPIDWPELICGNGYLLAIDTPLGDDPENIDLTMTLARRFG